LSILWLTEPVGALLATLREIDPAQLAVNERG
jgi:hypothetical protein